MFRSDICEAKKTNRKSRTIQFYYPAIYDSQCKKPEFSQKLNGFCLKIFARLETNRFARRDRNFLARARVAPDAAFSRFDDKNPKPAKLNALSFCKSILHCVKKRIDHLFCFLFGHVCFVSDLIDNIKFDPATILKFPFKQATYTLDMRELEDFLDNKSIFGGRMNARTEQTRAGQPIVFANHGALVANPQETSLRRFVDELTRDIQPDTEGAREARVQRVLDFVSREIKYDMRATTYNFELLKRPNEVLMSGESDCSNKAILLGSLLEQLGEDYLFVYTPDHITVAVKQGGFPASNGLFLGWQGEVWLIAEGTAPGFRIGIDHVQEEAKLKQFQHVQRPRDRDVIFDLATGRQLSFQ